MAVSNHLSQFQDRFKAVTTYNREQLDTKIVHIGFGAFHRGHQAVYNDLTNQASGELWGICEINMFGSEDLVANLVAQDCLFSVIEKSKDTVCSRLVRTVTEAIHTPVSGIAAAIAKIAEPQVSIVSLTITEKGYCVDPQSGLLDEANSLIQHDLANPQAPVSALGLITEALRVRRDQGLAPISILSCDNIPENGHLTKNAVLAYAAKLDQQLASWIEQNISFPSTMVDRICPAMTAEEFAAIEVEVGYADPCGVVCEDFRQWVIEDNFVAGRPDWDLAGAMFVNDVLPYEEMKLRMLNGSHSFLAYNGALAGYEYIYQCMQDPTFKAATLKLMTQEQAKSLSPNLNVDLEQYAGLLIERFSNANVKHKTAQIAMDGSQKLPQRAVDPLLQLQKQGLKVTCLPILIAGWMHSIIGAVKKGEQIVDPLADEFKHIVDSHAEPLAQAKALLAINKIFGTHASDNAKFSQQVESAFVSIEEYGIASVIDSIAVN
ncbi:MULTISPECIES: mannitol dehydrogenase family protein [unclassified Agarivorans]|uniref:mannitol dehydrogenase family protein n=1 Tax=unclassified Agarivorans TaxID=2636026 RepID=UPI0026E2ACF5|nr:MULTISPECIES: mannitol dehydrogenase family protein [unclassified Agarivorans]MDO6683835.1 mannitol dehydrogenase family protein [Agarivorans sp. 3_MG-2023]MDO6714432.1 mannitol dehydrogenase family protein [Agarivorans sp. 2_MG-2023]MDO6762331.1 mannitol dehydrogenase family protein [Agarivorans sp. 1_MG-2023]